LLSISKPFLRFLCKKILVFIGIFIVSGTLLFTIPRLMPSNPVEMMIVKILGGSMGTSIGTGGGGTTGGVTQGSMVEVLRRVYSERFGIGEPLHVQFILFWRRIFTFDFGISYSYYPAKVNDVVMRALPWTLALITPVPIIGFFIGNRIGSIVALKKGKAANIVYYLAMYLSIMPYYWFGMILIYVFGVVLRWFPTSGAYSSIWLKPQWTNPQFLLDVLHHYTLPFLSLVGQGIGGWALGMRASVASQAKSTYTLYMKHLGFSFQKIRKRIERNAILPNFTWLPMSFSGLVGQTLLVETVFGYPGVGSLMYDAAFSLDYPMLEATFLIIMLIVLVGNLICDIVYGILDPRIGSRYVSEEAQ